MPAGEPHWIVKHSLEVVIGALLLSALGWFGLTSDYRNRQDQEKTVPEPTSRTVSLAGEVLSMTVPDWWLQNPKNGSVNFSTHEEIEKTRQIKAGLSVRTEGANPRWAVAEPQVVLATLQDHEHLCDITNAADNGSRFYMGLQAHCKGFGVCSFGIEGTKLRVTIKDAELNIALDCNS